MNAKKKIDAALMSTCGCVQMQIVIVSCYICVLLQMRKDSLGEAIDRAKRYGSMRGQELAETVARMAGRAVS